MIYEIKRGNEIVWSGKAEGKQSRVIMQADMVEVTIKSPVAIAFQKGDTIQVYGEKYKLNRPENIAKQNTQIGYTYTVEFEALYYDLGKWILYTLDGSNKLTQPDVYLQGEARTILGLLVQNANRASSGWSLGIVDDTDVIQWTYSSAKLLTVLQDIADQTNLEFWVNGKTINLTRRQNDTGLSLAYGKGKGLYELARSRREDPIVTHLTVAGGSQNIPNSYGYRNIQPTGGNPMVNPAYKAGQDRVESVIVFENIYPRLNAKVTATNAINIIRSTDLDFDLNDHLLDDGTSAQIAFTSGLLNGFTFTIAKDGYTHANRQILFNAIVDDNAYPQGIPNAQMKPAIGDTFVLLNMDMPQSYVSISEERVQELGDQYFAEEGIEQYDWTGKLTPKFVLENAVELTLGGLVTLKAEDIGFNGSIRVDSYTRDLQQEYLYEFTLSNIITINKLVRERNMSDRLANTVSKGISQDGLSTKATFAERAGYAATAGHATTATTAATALRADHATNADNAIRAQKADVADYALDSDKWDGRQFADYLNQPVRTTDTPTLSGVVVNSQLRIPQVSNAATNALWKSGSYAMLGSAKVWAGRADLWNGFAQPDYLTQPVREIDSPRFAGISSERFVSGFAGEGYRISKDANGNVMAEFDRLTVRKDFTVYELIVSQIRATNGSLWISDAIKLESVVKSGSNYVCKIDTDQGTIYVPFVVNDILRCQRFNGRNMKYYVARVTATNYNDGTFTLVMIEGASVPEARDEVVRMGNTTDRNRQGAIYATASDNGAPYIDVIDGVTSASLAGKVKARFGKLDGIIDADFGQLSGYGLYANNVYLKGVLQIQAGSNVYTKTQSDGNVSTAKSEAISSAASDATTKANNARTQAISAAATDATSKANEALNTANQFATDAIKAINVGGRNRYSKNTPVERGNPNLTFQRPHADAPNGFHIIGVNGSQSTSSVKLNNVITENGDWTVSGYVRQTQGANLFFDIDVCGLGTANVSVPFNNQWRSFTLTVTVNNYSTSSNYVTFKNFAWAFYYFRDIKIEKGNRATDWTPAPEDVDDALAVVRVETNTRFNVLETEINSKVSQSNFNSLNQRVGSAETTINQQAGQIEQRATKTEFSSLTNNVNGLSGRLTTAEGSITTQAGQINLRATKTELNTAITNAENDATSKANNAQAGAKTYTDSQIKVIDDKIILKSDRTVTDALGSRLNSAEAKITPDAINLTVSGQVDSKISNIDIGGRNLVRNSNFAKGGNNWSINGGTVNFQSSQGRAHLVLTSNGQGIYQMNSGVIAGRTYTFSFETMATFQNGTSFRVGFDSGSVGSASRYINIPTSPTVWNKTTLTVVAPSNNNPIVFYNNAGARNEFYIRNIQMEEGNHATAWSPNPDDIDQQFSETQASISVVSDAVSLRATRVELNTAVTNASNDASSKANSALSNARSYTDSQIVVVNNAISLKSDQSTVNGINTRLQSAEAKITPAEIRLTVKSETQDLIESQAIGRNLLIFSLPWYQGNIFGGSDNGSDYIRNNNWINVSAFRNLTITRYIDSIAIYTIDLVEYRTADATGASYIRRTNVPGGTSQSSTTIALHSQTNFVRIVFYRGGGVSPSYAAIGRKLKVEAGTTATAYSPAPEDLPTRDEVQAGISITPNTVNVFGKAIKLSGMVTAESIKVDELLVQRLKTSENANRTSINEDGDGLLKVRHENGTIGIEMGLINGEPSMVFYNSQGTKLWEAGQAGIVYVNSTPATSTPVNLWLITSASALNQNDARSLLQSSSNSQNGQPKTPVGTVRYLYHAGNNADTSRYKEYEGYHTGTPYNSAWIPNGWYCVGNVFMSRDINAGNNYYTVRVMRIWGGKVTDNVTINDIFIMGNT